MRKRAVVALVVSGWIAAVACSAPEFGFSHPSSDASPDVVPSDARDATLTDGATELPPPATPIAPIEVAGADFATVCPAAAAKASIVDAGPVPAIDFLWTPDAGARHCYLYFANTPYGRMWSESKAACDLVTTTAPARKAHLATFPTQGEAAAVQAFYKSGQVPWIGLELHDTTAPTVKTSFGWGTGEAFGYDGWAPGTPAGTLCVAWATNTQWGDKPCEQRKGILCELDE